ncbi:MAG: ABC transporter substrate-binding protein, partial [Chloroflexota bacterium]|nr:ABC transporter substrate-binding protein [Chloroflexota bacterium]
MRVLTGHRFLRPLGKLSVLMMALPLLLAACGGSATSTPSTSATTTGATSAAPATSATAATGAGAATKPAASAASSTTAVGSTTASGTAAPGSGVTTASTGTDPRGAAPTKRGGGGTLHVLYWQAPTILNFHLAHGTKDDDASRVIEEPLATLSINAAVPDIPVLAKEIPSTANGELAADGMSVTWKLKDGVKWSDGTPFTSADVKATWQYIMKPETGATDIATFEPIASIDTPDATTAKITFKAPTAAWYLPFAAGGYPVLQKAQVDTCT